MAIRLIHVADGREYVLPEGESTLGRRAADICIPHGSLSKLHARLVVSGGSLRVADAGSKNGVLVNDQRTDQATTLRNGDRIQCGRATFEVAGLTGEEPAFGPRLRLVSGGPEQAWPLRGDVVPLGSKPDNDIVLAGEGVSRYHAELQREGEGWWVQDLGARNGVLLREQRVLRERLSPGDELTLGTCTLRFEVAQPHALSGLREAWDGARKDPVGALRRDARVRGMAAAACGLLGLALLAVPASSHFAKRQERVARGSWLAEGSALLREGRYEEARLLFRKAASHAPSGHQATPATLQRIAKLWREEDPQRFRWKRAQDLLAKTARCKGLGEELREWLGAQRACVDLNATASEHYRQGSELADRARGQAGQDLDAALASFDQALARYRIVPSESRFAADAASAADALAAEAFDLAMADAEERLRAQRPDWITLRSRLERAEGFAPDGQAQRVRSLLSTVRTNQEDDARYVHAAKLVTAQRPEGYPKARALLTAIGSRSKIYPDAQAYLAWLDADRAVRGAQAAYLSAQTRRAFELLQEAAASPCLGPAARQSIAARRTQWARVVKAYERGLRHSHAGEDARAVAELQRVLNLEKDARCRLRVRAEEELAHIRRRQREALEARLEEGLHDLSKGRLSEACGAFEKVREDPHKRPGDLLRVEEAVVSYEADHELLASAKARLLRDEKGAFLQIRDALRLLARWLPKGHPERAPARKHLAQVKDRIDAWEAGRSLK